jgi:hypothetical protein
MVEISPEKVCFMIAKAHQYAVKVEPVEPDPGSNPADDGMRVVLENHADDPVAEEITSFIADLNEDEQVDLVALLWLGRDGWVAEDWSRVRAEAARAHNEHTAEYLMGTPLLADYLSEGLARLGYSCEEYELQHQ